MKFVAAALLLGGLMMATPALAADALSIETNLKFLEDNKKMKGVITRPSGLEFRIIQNGYGKRPQPTDTVKVYYTGKMINGVIFDGTSPGLPYCKPPTPNTYQVAVLGRNTARSAMPSPV